MALFGGNRSVDRLNGCGWIFFEHSITPNNAGRQQPRISAQGSSDKSACSEELALDEESAFSSTELNLVSWLRKALVWDAQVHPNVEQRKVRSTVSGLSDFLRRQAYREDGAASRPFVYADGAAMNLNGALHDRQSETGVVLAAAVAAPKAAED